VNFKFSLAPIAILLFMGAPVSSVSAQAGIPRFEYFPAGKIYKGPTAPVRITKDDRAFKQDSNGRKTSEAQLRRSLHPDNLGMWRGVSFGCGQLTQKRAK
jgi:hypothetical protein